MEENISRGRFIRLGAALGVGAAGASVLAACGGGESGGSGGGGGDTGGATGGGSGGAATQAQTTTESAPAETTQAPEQQASGGTAIASESEVAPGSARPFQDGGQDAVLVHLDSGEFVAYSAVCTHQGCTVAYRNDQGLVCPCHGSVFDPANGGAVVSPPAEQPLPEIPVEVRGGEVFKA